jgi:hypothetical protein
MEFESAEGVIIHIWNKYSTELLELGICADLIRVKNNYELCIYHNNNIRNIKFKSEKKKGGCESCKEKATKLEQKKESIFDNLHFLNYQETIDIVSNEDILFAHKILKASGSIQADKDKVNKIYKSIFNENIEYSCCKKQAYFKLDNYVRNTLELL